MGFCDAIRRKVRSPGTNPQRNFVLRCRVYRLGLGLCICRGLKFNSGDDMATKWENRTVGYNDLESAIKKYSAKELKGQVDLFLKQYKVVAEAEEKLAPALIKARGKGVEGTELADFRKDKEFNDAYKGLDHAVDALWKEQVKCSNMGNEARQTINDLKTLAEHISSDLATHEKELEASRESLKKDQAKAKAGKGTLTPSTIKEADTLEREFKKYAPDLEKLNKDIAGDLKDLTEAAGIYKREVDQKMDNYAAKFEKTIAKTLDLAPKAGADQAGLPTALQERVLLVAAKKAVSSAKDIEKFCKYALEKAETDKALAAPDLKAARTGLDALKKVLTAQRAIRKKYAAQIKKAKNSKQLYGQFKDMDEAFAGAEKKLVTTMKEIAGKA